LNTPAQLLFAACSLAMIPNAIEAGADDVSGRPVSYAFADVKTMQITSIIAAGWHNSTHHNPTIATK
jgi:hypothetical protein